MNDLKSLPGIALILIVFAITVALGVSLMDNMGQSAKEPLSVLNRTATINTTGHGNLGDVDDEYLSLTAARNSTHHTQATTNYTIDTAGAISSGYTVSETHYFDFSYNAETSATLVLGNTTAAVGDLGDTWLSPIVIVVIAVVIIGLLFGAIAYIGGTRRR